VPMAHQDSERKLDRGETTPKLFRFCLGCNPVCHIFLQATHLRHRYSDIPPISVTYWKTSSNSDDLHTGHALFHMIPPFHLLYSAYTKKSLGFGFTHPSGHVWHVGRGIQFPLFIFLSCSPKKSGDFPSFLPFFLDLHG